MDVEEATKRWKEYVDYLKRRRDGIPHLSEKENVTSFGELKYNINLSTLALAFIIIPVIIPFLITVYNRDNDSLIISSWVIYIVYGLILGMCVVFQNTVYVKAVNKKFDELDIQYVWDNHRDVMQENKIFENDNKYEQLTDIKLDNDILNASKNK
jgi:uncharacterized membrane protein